MLIEQILVLAVVQGITEFLPISSSGHLILVPALTGWPDQGHMVDVMVHVGSLFAILAYFWRDVLALAQGGLALLTGRMTDYGRLALFIVAASLPAIAFGLFLKSTGWSDALRSTELIAWNAIVFGVLLYLADRFGPAEKTMAELRFVPAFAIGVAQAIALIPGVSRSGITMTAGRALGLTRPEAARFSFLLGIPAMAGAGVLTFVEAAETGVVIGPDAWAAAFFSFFSALAAIAFLMALVRRMSFLPFVIYRVALGVALLVWFV
jgi:undecaprenyl-diphosphatase